MQIFERIIKQSRVKNLEIIISLGFRDHPPRFHVKYPFIRLIIPDSGRVGQGFWVPCCYCPGLHHPLTTIPVCRAWSSPGRWWYIGPASRRRRSLLLPLAHKGSIGLGFWNLGFSVEARRRFTGCPSLPSSSLTGRLPCSLAPSLSGLS